MSFASSTKSEQFPGLELPLMSVLTATSLTPKTITSRLKHMVKQKSDCSRYCCRLCWKIATATATFAASSADYCQWQQHDASNCMKRGIAIKHNADPGPISP